MTKDRFDENERALLGDDVLPAEPKAPTPQESRVVLMPGNISVAAGGRAVISRSRTSLARPGRANPEDVAYHASIAAERQQFIEQDPVVLNARGDSLALLSTLKVEVARETAALAYQRTVAERAGRDATAISSRRIEALRKIADIELEMRKIGFDKIDVHGEKFQRVMALWIDTIRHVAEETLTPEQVDIFFNRLTTEMSNWEDKAEEVMR